MMKTLLLETARSGTERGRGKKRGSKATHHIAEVLTMAAGPMAWLLGTVFPKSFLDRRGYPCSRGRVKRRQSPVSSFQSDAPGRGEGVPGSEHRSPALHTG